MTTIQPLQPTPLRSKAAHVLATSQDPDARSVAASVLGRDEPQTPTRSLRELQNLLAKVSGIDGQTERVKMIEGMIQGIRDNG